MSQEKEYINNAISTYITKSNLLEFSDRMNPATVMNFANVHARGKEKDANGRKVYSTISILATDFSSGTGDKSKRTEANISPSEARYILAKVESGMNARGTGTIFESSKIFGPADSKGYASMRILKISRQQTKKVGENEEPSKYPWTVSVDNGKAIKEGAANGAAWAKSGSYVSYAKVTVNLTDQDFFCMMSEVVSYINIWEMTFGSKIIREGSTILMSRMEEAAAEEAKNPKPKKETPPPKQAAPSAPIDTGGLSVEDAFNFVVDIGSNKGKTLSEVYDEKGVGAVEWYLNKMTANKPELKRAAQVIVNYDSTQKAG